MANDFKVVGPDTPQPEDVVTEEEVQTPTPLRSLKVRRAELVENLYLDHPVPRYSDPQVFIRFHAVESKKLNASVKSRENQGKRDPKIDWQLLANCDLLEECCEGIYAIWPDAPDEKVALSGSGHWSKFDQETAIALGVEKEALYPTDVVRKLFFTDGDLIAAANALLIWSNEASQKSDEDF